MSSLTTPAFVDQLQPFLLIAAHSRDVDFGDLKPAVREVFTNSDQRTRKSLMTGQWRGGKMI